MTDKEKAINWFENIAEECDKLTSGNVAHLKAQIKGMAIRSAEYLKKQEPANEDLEDAASSFAREDSKGIKNPANFYYTVADKVRIFKAGAQWQKAQMMKGVVEGKVVAVRTSMSDKLHTYPWIELEAQLSKNDKVKVIIIKE